MDVQFFVLCILLLSMFGALCIAVYRYKGLPLVLKPITWYLLVDFMVECLILTFMWCYPKQNSYFLFHIGFVLEAITLLLMYREIFKKYVEVGGKGNYVYRKIFILLIVVFVLFAIINSIWLQSLTIYPTNTRVALSVILIIFNILYIYKHTISEPIPRTGLELVNYQMSRVSLFWITTGLLLFHSFALFSYLFINRFQKELSPESRKDVLFVYTGFAIILFVFIGIGILKAKRIIVVNDKADNKQ